MRGKLEKATTDKIYVTENGRRREATEKLDIKQVCMNENLQRFTQAFNTPPMASPLLQDLGLTAEEETTKEMHEGTHIPSMECDMHAAQLLQHLEIPKATLESDPAVDFVDVEDHVRGWKKQKEHTGSDPDGLSFSHYIAACEDEEIAQFDTNIRSMPYTY